jgi:hypothetical protein
MIKDSRKCDSLFAALKAKDELINNLTKNNLLSFEEFFSERQKKQKAIIERNKAFEKMNSLKNKRLSIGIGVGPALTSRFKIEPAITLGINFKIFQL